MTLKLAYAIHNSKKHLILQRRQKRVQTFSTKELQCSCSMFLAFLIFEPNWPFCKGHLQPLQDSLLSKLSHFSNVWRFFRAVFKQNNSYVLVEWPLHRLQLLQDGRFLKLSHFSSIWYFFRAVLCREQLYCSCRTVNFWPRPTILQKLLPLQDGRFSNCLISRILGVFLAFFYTEQIQCSFKMVFGMFFGIFNFWPKLTILQRLNSLWKIFKRPIFKFVSFLKYSVFCTEQLHCSCRMVFEMS